MSNFCPECESPLIGGRCSKVCGWQPDAPKPKPKCITVQHKEYIPDEVLQAEKERIAELKAKYPNDWQTRIKDEVKKVIDGHKVKHENHKQIEFSKYQQELREEVPYLSDLAFVCASRPPSHDKEATAEYIERLKRVQHVLPTTEAVNG